MALSMKILGWKCLHILISKISVKDNLHLTEILYAYQVTSATVERVFSYLETESIMILMNKLNWKLSQA